MKWLKLSGILLLSVLTGCMSNDIYYWGHYEQTLYEYQKSPNQTNLDRHKSQLRQIIANAEQRGLLVPPGVYFELGMMEAKAGNVQRSIQLLTQEKNAFPEAAVYVDNAITMLEQGS